MLVRELISLAIDVHEDVVAARATSAATPGIGMTRLRSAGDSPRPARQFDVVFLVVQLKRGASIVPVSSERSEELLSRPDPSLARDDTIEWASSVPPAPMAACRPGTRRDLAHRARVQRGSASNASAGPAATAARRRSPVGIQEPCGSRPSQRRVVQQPAQEAGVGPAASSTKSRSACPRGASPRRGRRPTRSAWPDRSTRGDFAPSTMPLSTRTPRRPALPAQHRPVVGV